MVTSGKLSGYSYVSAHLREDGTTGYLQIYYQRNAAKCDHKETICPSEACVRMWATDYKLHLTRTRAGKDLIEKVGPEVVAWVKKHEWDSEPPLSNMSD